MTQSPTPVLEREMIAEPRLWRLYMLVRQQSLEVMLFNIHDSAGLKHFSIPLNPNGSDHFLERLEKAVYANELLLADFSRVSVIVDTPRMMVVPLEVAADEPTLAQVIAAQMPQADKIEAVVTPIPAQKVAVVGAIDQALMGFLRRTFHNPAVAHRFAPLCHYFLDKSRIGNPGKMYALLRDDSFDLMVFGRNSLRLANTYAIHKPIDAVYYIMAMRAELGLNPDTDELILAGHQPTRNAITPILREYIASVMPAIYPSAMFQSGKLMADAPFELIVMPLCE